MDERAKRQAATVITENPVYLPESGLRSATVDWLTANAPGWVLSNLMLLADLRYDAPRDLVNYNRASNPDGI
jgi:hypothetical protein